MLYVFRIRKLNITMFCLIITKLSYSIVNFGLVEKEKKKEYPGKERNILLEFFTPKACR